MNSRIHILIGIAIAKSHGITDAERHPRRRKGNCETAALKPLWGGMSTLPVQEDWDECIDSIGISEI